MRKILFFLFCLVGGALLSAQKISLSKKVAPMIDTLVAHMVFVEGGTLHYNSQGVAFISGQRSKKRVQVEDFYIGKYEVTRAEWARVMRLAPPDSLEANLPQTLITYDEIQEFIRRLNRRTGLLFALPTEAEWLYAERGGKRSRGYTYTGGNQLEEIAWLTDELHPVGEKLPNELGLYDMTGNAWEFTRQFFYERAEQSVSLDFEVVPLWVIRRGLYPSITLSEVSFKRYDCGFRLYLRAKP